MYYIAVFLFLIGGYWLYNGLRANDFGSIQFGAAILITAVGVSFITYSALSTLAL